MDFEEYLKQAAQAIDQEVEKILVEFLNETKKTNIKLIPFVLGLINSCKGGKRIRGVLVKLGYELASMTTDYGLPSTAEVGSQKTVDILKISAAFEILHAALLIHDDIMDQSPTRRGQPSLYKALGGDHYGISQAINIGDIALYLPIKIITESAFLGEYKLKALSLLSQTIINTGWGQILDIEGSKDDIEFIRINKTAKYTISAPLQLGAILAGAEDKLIKQLGGFGDNLGIAFQIKDDILDGEIGSVDQELVKALEYAKEAKKVIPEISSDISMRKLLEQMCEFMVNRDK